MTISNVVTPDGRSLEVLTGGAPDGFPWLYHSGSPSAAVDYEPFDAAARRAGLRLITYSRPGYGASSPRTPEQGPPRFADDVADSITILDHLGAGDFVTLGWSGGGPRALACAALLPERCRAATTLASVAPHEAPDLDWFAGMAPENVEEYGAAVQGPEIYGAFVEAEILPMLNVSAPDLAAGMGELLTPVDLAALDDSYTEYLAATFRRAAAQGIVGVRDDGLACVAEWGFEVEQIAVPVSVWQGDQDAMVPFDHGRWLADHVPGARAHLLPGEGHLSVAARIDDILADLKDLARL